MHFYVVELITDGQFLRHHFYLIRADRPHQAERWAVEALREDGVTSAILDKRVTPARRNGPRVLFIAGY